MRVIVVTNLYPNSAEPNRAPFNRAQFQALAQEHDVRVLAPVAWTDRFALFRRGGLTIPFREQRNGIEVVHPTYFFPPRILRGIYGQCYFFSMVGSLRKLLQEHPADILLGSWAYPDGFASVLAGRQLGLPVAIKVHGTDIHDMREVSRVRRTAWALRQACGVLAVSEDLRQRVIALGCSPEKAVLVYNGIDTERFKPGDKVAARCALGEEGAPLLLAVGRLEPIKDFETLLTAMTDLLRKFPAARLRIIGAGSLRESLEARVLQEHLSGAVRLLGEMDQDRIHQYYNAADLLLIPSRNEGVPNVLLEAMACGLPVVATRVGGIPEVVLDGSTGLLYDASAGARGLVSAIERAVAMTWSAPDILARIGRFSWRSSAHQLGTQLKQWGEQS